MLVLDGSGSMWGQIDGTPKITIARDAIDTMMGDWPANSPIGLMAYGHRQEGQCGDIETLIEPGSLNRAAFRQAMESVTPRGKTPIGRSVERAAEALSHEDRAASVIVVTDGLENCGADLCELGSHLEASGMAFTAHVIGFDIGDEEGQLACLAEATGGRYLPASNADNLTEALQTVSEPEPEPAETLFVDEFERSELGPDWTIDYPEPSGFILDNGVLVTMTVRAGGIGDAEDQPNIFRWTGAELPDGDWDLSADFTARMGEVKSLGGRRAIIQVSRFADADNHISAYVVRQGNSNDDMWLRVRSVSDGNASVSDVEIAGDLRGYDLAQILRDFEEKGARLTLSKRGRDYLGRLEMNGWTMQEGGPEAIETPPLQVLLTSGAPAIFAGTLGSEQTVAEFDRVEIRGAP
ncbi:von Willebrand factor type A domain-containing protein [Halomonas daqiaonensis]|uniref:von Willebrand factor type A domain-containing protein n=2 Tax=Halomonas daqiaonensis TaxID=650850 RepID=A0A1H7FKB7_9GAMM|nr:von Willebrand factor type A domain-containing protein [Halomonas daqiaonensis]